MGIEYHLSCGSSDCVMDTIVGSICVVYDIFLFDGFNVKYYIKNQTKILLYNNVCWSPKYIEYTNR